MKARFFARWARILLGRNPLNPLAIRKSLASRSHVSPTWTGVRRDTVCISWSGLFRETSSYPDPLREISLMMLDSDALKVKGAENGPKPFKMMRGKNVVHSQVRKKTG